MFYIDSTDWGCSVANVAEQVEVLPTGNPASGQHSDIALTSLFNSHAAVLNSERQTIRQRYNAMLIANSFILGLLDRQQPRFIGALFGLLLCGAWAVLTWSGFKLFSTQMTEMGKFSWPGFSTRVNPVHVGFAYREEGDWIYRMAWAVIVLFGLAYVWLLIQA